MEIQQAGIKSKDALNLACAIESGCWCSTLGDKKRPEVADAPMPPEGSKGLTSKTILRVTNLD